MLNNWNQTSALTALLVATKAPRLWLLGRADLSLSIAIGPPTCFKPAGSSANHKDETDSAVDRCITQAERWGGRSWDFQAANPWYVTILVELIRSGARAWGSIPI